jgi:hypothetical protein
MQILIKADITGFANSSKGNPRNIRFLDAPTGFTDAIDNTPGKEKGSFRDPWGNRYGIAMDLNYTNKININGTYVQGTVFVWSFGPPTNAGLSLFTNNYGASPNIPSWQE